MSTNDELTRHFSEISDEELVNRIKSGSLTELAYEIAKTELASRKINMDLVINKASSETLSKSNRVPRHIAISTIFGSPIFNRILRFPYRAILGVEPFWVVFIFGITIAYAVHKFVTYFIAQLVFSTPIPPNTLSLSYAALGLSAIVRLWLSVALWRSADNSKIFVVNIFARVLAILCILSAFWGTINVVNIVKQYVPESTSVISSGRMD